MVLMGRHPALNPKEILAQEEGLLAAIVALVEDEGNSMMILRSMASFLCVIGVTSLLMYSGHFLGTYERKELLKDIGLWSLVGCLGSYFLCVYIIFRKIK